MSTATHKHGTTSRPSRSKAASSATSSRPKSPDSQRGARRWSQQVTEHSNAMDVQPDIFKMDNPRAIAKSLLASAETSRRRKTTPLRSAMSMLSFYVNRAGKGLSASRKDVLVRAKEELRKLAKHPAAPH